MCSTHISPWAQYYTRKLGGEEEKFSINFFLMEGYVCHFQEIHFPSYCSDRDDIDGKDHCHIKFYGVLTYSLIVCIRSNDKVKWNA